METRAILRVVRIGEIRGGVGGIRGNYGSTAEIRVSGPPSSSRNSTSRGAPARGRSDGSTSKWKAALSGGGASIRPSA